VGRPRLIFKKNSMIQSSNFYIIFVFIISNVEIVISFLSSDLVAVCILDGSLLILADSTSIDKFMSVSLVVQ
jgi:hypothetical protein